MSHAAADTADAADAALGASGKLRTAPKSSTPVNRWRSSSKERAYRRRLVEVLCSAAANSRSSGPCSIKEAADSALATTAHGRSRWSRAILFARRCRGGGSSSRKLLAKAGGTRCRLTSAPPPPTKKGNKLGHRLRALGRLVPGCRKLPALTLLEEAADYLAALEMQAKALRDLTDILSAAESGGVPPEN
ncbi:transcription factor bHLH150-like [Zingiber officinale]|uniref:transcription factor bHLH150-like n=1 Tax=Zingiber officinale TaxID=94328 RepID=UPI001C4B4996|nr:transcription factor bHLH150-like [Zingiber officinale]